MAATDTRTMCFKRSVLGCIRLSWCC